VVPELSPAAEMISDRDVWAAALLIVKRYGDDAMLEAAQRADQLLDGGRHGRRRDVASHLERDRAAAGQGAGGGREGALGAACSSEISLNWSANALAKI
jgi:hypothetical protein